MKRFILFVISCIFVVALTGRYSFSQTESGMKGEQKQQGIKMDEGITSMTKKMMGDKKEMMQMMMGMMDQIKKSIWLYYRNRS
jgi:hypothetical protein